jgi:NAD(P)-dependent dehydrogenase (short-subunit alcohol dehydrogenase family)
MRVIVVGATGTIGRAVVEALTPRHEIVAVSHRQAPIRVDLADRDSVARMYETIGQVDAVISAAGRARFAPLRELTDADFAMSLANKLMGQVNLVRLGHPSVRDGGSFTLTSGYLGRYPAPGSPAVSLVNAAVEGFVRAAALELPRGIRINAVSPRWIRETLQAPGRDPSPGLPVAVVAQAYVKSLEGNQTGAVLDP